MRSITRALALEVKNSKKFAEKKGAGIVEGIFPFPVLLRRKSIFENILRDVQGLSRFFCKRKAARKQGLDAAE